MINGGSNVKSPGIVFMNEGNSYNKDNAKDQYNSKNQGSLTNKSKAGREILNFFNFDNSAEETGSSSSTHLRDKKFEQLQKL